MFDQSTEPMKPSPLATSSPRVHAQRPQHHSQHRNLTDADAHKRTAGVFVHITSLPGPDGIGDLGAPSREFIEFLTQADQHLWQTLPLHPPSNHSMSPYDAASAFAGNPLLISLDDLSELGLLPDTLTDIRRAVGAGYLADDERAVAGSIGGADPLDRVARWKLPLVRQAARQLLGLASSHELHQAFMAFCEREAYWLADYVAFTALRDEYPGVPRSQWPVEDRIRRLGAHRARSLTLGATHEHTEAAVQFLFDMQIRRMHAYARSQGVQIVGDAPIYVGEDSADVWAHPELFQLDNAALPAVQTGAPPDAMDPGGQVWPMPAYDWEANATRGYDWWLQRLQREFMTADVVRIDHFRAFADWWSLPPRALYANEGRWEPGPGMAFFDHVKQQLGELDLVLEDLGADTDALHTLRDQVGFPLMRVLVQGFDEGGDSAHLPNAWNGNEIAYTATHDYDTILGWAQRAAAAASSSDADRRLAFALRYTGASDVPELPHAAIVSVLASGAERVIIPIQDWLQLDSRSRMNVPGTAHGNWRWLLPNGALDEHLAAAMSYATAQASRNTLVPA
jgi:4-alpha-glucanotransferase